MRCRRGTATILLLTAVGAACSATPPPPTRPLVIATAVTGGAYAQVGTALATVWSARVPGLVPEVVSGGSGRNLNAIEAGRAQVAFAQADMAYSAFRRGVGESTAPFANLRAIALLWHSAMQVVVPADSPIRSVRDLRGQRVVAGAPGTGNQALTAIALGAYGMSYDDLRPEFANFTRGAAALREGSADAAVIVAGIPADGVAELGRARPIRLVPIPRNDVQRLRAQFPFLEPATVAAGTYTGQTDDIPTIGVRNLLVCRADLDEDLVSALTAALFDALPQLAASHPSAALIDVTVAPATPIPLHPGAARYYRARELTR